MRRQTKTQKAHTATTQDNIKRRPTFRTSHHRVAKLSAGAATGRPAVSRSPLCACCVLVVCLLCVCCVFVVCLLCVCCVFWVYETCGNLPKSRAAPRTPPGLAPPPGCAARGTGRRRARPPPPPPPPLLLPTPRSRRRWRPHAAAASAQEGGVSGRRRGLGASFKTVI